MLALEFFMFLEPILLTVLILYLPVTLITFMFFFFFQAEDGIRDYKVTGVQTCALPIYTPASSVWPCMPVTDAQGHTELAGVWAKLGAHPQVKVVLVRSEGKAFCAGGEIGRASCRERV